MNGTHILVFKDPIDSKLTVSHELNKRIKCANGTHELAHEEFSNYINPPLHGNEIVLGKSFLMPWHN